jgi:hypothetical protein
VSISARACLAAALLVLALPLGPAAHAQTVVDGSDRAIPEGDLPRIVSLLADGEVGKLAGHELRALRRGSTVSSLIYCGEIRGPRLPRFAPFLANLTAGQRYVLLPGLPKDDLNLTRERLAAFCGVRAGG